MQAVEYDSCGRMFYNPEFHPHHGESWSESDLEYLCKYHEYDGLKCMELALGRTQKTIASKITDMRKNGKYQYYKNLNKHW